MHSKMFVRALALAAVPLMLAACDTIDSTFKALTGSGASNPNYDQELRAADDSVRRPPLTLPPDFNLRPPSATSAAGATDLTAAQQGRQTVFGIDQPNDAKTQRSAGASTGEGALLQHAGATAGSAAIRQKVDKETDALTNQQKGFDNNLLNPQGAAQADKDSGWFSGLFGDSSKPSIER